MADLRLGAVPSDLRPIPSALRSLFLDAGCRSDCELGVHLKQGEGADVYHAAGGGDPDQPSALVLVETIPWHEVEGYPTVEARARNEPPDEQHNPWPRIAVATGKLHRGAR